MFKKGPLGLGYYVDDPDVVVRAFTTESQSPPHDMVLAYILQSCPRGHEGRTIISLEQLIPDISSSGEACARRPRLTKRRPRRRRKCRSANACEWTPPSCLGVSKLSWILLIAIVEFGFLIRSMAIPCQRHTPTLPARPLTSCVSRSRAWLLPTPRQQKGPPGM